MDNKLQKCNKVIINYNVRYLKKLTGHKVWYKNIADNHKTDFIISLYQ